MANMTIVVWAKKRVFFVVVVFLLQLVNEVVYIRRSWIFVW